MRRGLITVEFGPDQQCDSWQSQFIEKWMFNRVMARSKNDGWIKVTRIPNRLCVAYLVMSLCGQSLLQPRVYK